jgi:hypothetical protein
VRGYPPLQVRIASSCSTKNLIEGGVSGKRPNFCGFLKEKARLFKGLYLLNERKYSISFFYGSHSLQLSTPAAECQVTKILIGPGNKKALKKKQQPLKFSSTVPNHNLPLLLVKIITPNLDQPARKRV